MDEMIAVVPRDALTSAHLLRHGFTPSDDAILAHLEAHLVWTPRGPAETDPSLKQLIPYVVVTRGGCVYATERLTAGSEARLHGKISIGAGGHIEAHDASPRVVNGMLRELHEELVIPEVAPTFVGLINDDTNAVGQVHLGLVFVVEVPPRSVVDVRETHKLVGAFRGKAWFAAHHDRLESWSAHVLAGLDLKMTSCGS